MRGHALRFLEKPEVTLGHGIDGITLASALHRGQAARARLARIRMDFQHRARQLVAPGLFGQ